ncbi:phenylacetaldoxime dehydratase [Bordetella genomosp. 8]|uniref:Phenylacetaldoxime dehydratase n=1 Tax=Bordetella genomosp. 8 TaxID=1416806 RepID=A0A1W6YUJ7_9BORD|nr:phenylacetaldoxime dehydratase [Bordetella genomosp. 8]
MNFHVEYPRTEPLRRPDSHSPGAPKFSVRWDKPVASIVSDYIAVQHAADDRDTPVAFFQRVRDAMGRANGPDSFEELRHRDQAGWVNSIVVAYWTDATKYEAWRREDRFNHWLSEPERERGDSGYWRETFVVPYDRHETIFSERFYTAGIARTDRGSLQPMYVAGYFGAMRDRIPLAAIDPLRSPCAHAPARDYRGGPKKRIRVTLPINVVAIRSGQYWAMAEAEQLSDYETNLQPKLEAGMQSLKDAPDETGCLVLRDLVNLDADGNERRETSKYGYFLSLAKLEEWSAGHAKHLDIFKHALAMRRKYGDRRSVVTWHEVFVLGSSPILEYVNCHAETGLLPYASSWGSAVMPT